MICTYGKNLFTYVANVQVVVAPSGGRFSENYAYVTLEGALHGMFPGACQMVD